MPITSPGTHTNTVHRTGAATLSERGSDTHTIAFTITFAGWQGVLVGTPTEAGEADETAPVVGGATIIPSGGRCENGVGFLTTVGSAVSTI
jgi:hypothetical protein